MKQQVKQVTQRVPKDAKKEFDNDFLLQCMREIFSAMVMAQFGVNPNTPNIDKLKQMVASSPLQVPGVDHKSKKPKSLLKTRKKPTSAKR